MARVWVNPHTDARGRQVDGHWRQIKGRAHRPLPTKTGLGKGMNAQLVRSNRAKARAGSARHVALAAKRPRSKLPLRRNQRRARKLRTKR